MPRPNEKLNAGSLRTVAREMAALGVELTPGQVGEAVDAFVLRLRDAFRRLGVKESRLTDVEVLALTDEFRSRAGQRGEGKT